MTKTAKRKARRDLIDRLKDVRRVFGEGGEFYATVTDAILEIERLRATFEKPMTGFSEKDLKAMRAEYKP